MLFRNVTIDAEAPDMIGRAGAMKYLEVYKHFEAAKKSITIALEGSTSKARMHSATRLRGALFGYAKRRGVRLRTRLVPGPDDPIELYIEKVA